MALEERQENLEEIRKVVERQLKKEKQLSADELNKLMADAMENVDFLKVLDEINVTSNGKRVIFVDGKACLVYDSGVFYIEDSMDTKKGKKKLTKNQATELYVEYFFRYILNPALEQKKLHEQVRSVATRINKEKEKAIKEPKVKSEPVRTRSEIEKDKDKEIEKEITVGMKKEERVR